MLPESLSITSTLITLLIKKKMGGWSEDGRRTPCDRTHLEKALSMSLFSCLVLSGPILSYISTNFLPFIHKAYDQGFLNNEVSP